jgi:serine/threonine protein kinase
MPSAEADTAPLVIAGRYALEQLIGRGGMGEVYLARHVTIGSRVAVKFFLPRLADAEEYQLRFLAEARVGVSLTHPGIAQVLDSGREPDGRLYIVFEYIEGEDLRRALGKGALAWDEARHIVLSVAEALAFAHSRDVVHRDLKPENLVVRRDLNQTHVKVLDFGIARERGSARLTMTGTVAGTPAYMAPEQVLGEEVDARADVYGLGLIFFELLTGQRAVQQTDAGRALMWQLNEPLPRLGDVVPGRDWAPLDEFLADACAKLPDHRIADMPAFIARLRDLPAPPWASSAPVVTRSSPRRKPSTRRVALATPAGRARSAHPVVKAVAAAALVATGALLASRTDGGEPRSGEAAARAEVEPARPAPAPPSQPVFPESPALAATPPARGTVIAAPTGARQVTLSNVTSKRATPDVDASSGCSELQTEAQLRDQLRSFPWLPASQAEQSFRYIDLAVADLAPELRECQRRVALAANIVALKAMERQLPVAWAYAKSREQLRALFRTAAMRNPWTSEQREDLLSQIDLGVATIREGDRPYFLRTNLGTMIACELTDDAAKDLGIAQPGYCGAYFSRLGPAGAPTARSP